MATIIDGKELSKKLKEQMKDRVAQMRQQGIVPKLVVVLVGNNSASEVYVRNKHKACGEVGIESEVIKMPEETTQQELLDVVKGLNEDRTVDGILVQLPLPGQINEKVVLRSILPEKDVDGFHPVNVGLLSIGDDCYAPATPSGIIAMFKEYGIEIAGKHCVIIGRSNIVGKPMAALLLRHNATVAVCHSKTQNRGHRTPPHPDRRHGQGGRGGHRRRHEPQRAGQAVRRRRLRRSQGKGLVHHTGAGRRRPDDHHRAAGKHHPGSPKTSQLRLRGEESALPLVLFSSPMGKSHPVRRRDKMPPQQSGKIAPNREKTA